MLIPFLANLVSLTQAPLLIAPGASQSIHQAVHAIEARMAVGDFAGARKGLRLLPKPKITFKWDDSKVPQAQRPAFTVARDDAFKQWRLTMPGLDIKPVAETPDIKIDFEPVLATQAGRSAPSPSTLFFSEAVREPRMECVIGLRRGEPLTGITRDEVYDEVGYAVGAFLGLAPSPFVGYFMGRTEVAGQPAYRVGLQEWRLAKSNLSLVAELQRAIEAKLRISPTRSSVFIDPSVMTLPNATQGDRVPFSIQISNSGDGPLSYEVTPDCGCITADKGLVLKPGASTLARAQMDTHEFKGDFNKRLIVATNDVEHPYIQIPVAIHVTPLYRLLGPGRSIAITAQEASVDVYLALASKATFHPKEARVNGVAGSVTYEPWEGSLPDPELGENTSSPRKGYRFHLSIDPKSLLGRTWVSLEVLTDDDYFQILRYNLTVQVGIAPSPSQLFMGNLGATPKDFNLEIGFPGKPFRIVGVEFDTSHLKATPSSQTSDDHKLTISYDGHASSGSFRGTIRIKTDDPNQPTIDVPYLAAVS